MTWNNKKDEGTFTDEKGLRRYEDQMQDGLPGWTLETKPVLVEKMGNPYKRYSSANSTKSILIN